MRTFRRLLLNTLVASTGSIFLWFAVTFWTYLETRSVVATSVISGAFGILSAASGLVSGTYVDRHRKHPTMMLSSTVTVIATLAAIPVYRWTASTSGSISLGQPSLWLLILLIMTGSVAANLRGIALGTCVSLLVPDTERERANGMVGAVTGVSFVVTSVFSGLVVGQLGMGWALVIGLAVAVVSLVQLATIDIPEAEPQRDRAREQLIDVKGAIESIRATPGLGWLVALASFNNLLGGVFMSLMDAYGLELVRVEIWGLVFAFTSCGFVIGGLLVARFGLGGKPLARLMAGNIVCWTVAALFPIGPSIVMVAIGSLVWLTTMPVIEAAEQTVLQRAVPFERQGRVFGFAQAVEMAAAPVTALVIGPIATEVTIPFMTSGVGVDWLGGLLGTGVVGGLGVCFFAAGLIGVLAVTLGRFSKPYRRLEQSLA
jgi:MFS transporter, DHA3 family, multidrug efflux protein